MNRLLAFLLPFTLLADEPLSAPHLGLLVAHGKAVAVRGIPGAFVLQDVAHALCVPRGDSSRRLSNDCETVLTTVCSDQACLVKTEAAILTPSSIIPAPPGRMLATFTSDGALLYFPESRQFGRLHACPAWSGLQPATETSVSDSECGRGLKPPLQAEARSTGIVLEAWETAGEVASLREIGGRLEIAVRRDGKTLIVTHEGAVLDTIDTNGPLLLVADGYLMQSSGELVYRRAHGEQIAFPLSDIESIAAFAPGYASIATGHGSYLLRLMPGREELFQLPEAAE